MKLSIIIPSYGREQVLVETLQALIALKRPAFEILVVDQTLDHDEEVERQLQAWDDTSVIRWIHQSPPGVVAAMNRGLNDARGDLVLFLDDDIAPSANLVAAHLRAHRDRPDLWAVAGQVLQPGQEPDPAVVHAPQSGLRADMDFAFNADQACEIKNVMAGNLSVKKQHALSIGGFDEHFIPPVSFRFESDFARRIIRAGGHIYFEPRASIRHLAAPSGGTRSLGSHLTSASPLHGVGDYYFALRHGRGLERLAYMFYRPFREVRTRFHLAHPWYIPVKLVGEFRAIALALSLPRRK